MCIFDVFHVKSGSVNKAPATIFCTDLSSEPANRTYSAWNFGDSNAFADFTAAETECLAAEGYINTPENRTICDQALNYGDGGLNLNTFVDPNFKHDGYKGYADGSHTYKMAGTYHVTLTSTWNLGSDTAPVYVTYSQKQTINVISLTPVIHLGNG